MSGNDIALWVRAKIHDMHKAKVSDFELRVFIGMVQEWIFHMAADLGSPLVATSTELTLTDGAVAVPNDFHKLRAIKTALGDLSPKTPEVDVDSSSYKILGNTLYSENTTLTMVYYKSPTMPVTLESTLDLNDAFRALMVDGVSALAGGGSNVEVQMLLKAQIGDVIARREFPVASIDTPWQV